MRRHSSFNRKDMDLIVPQLFYKDSFGIKKNVEGWYALKLSNQTKSLNNQGFLAMALNCIW